jgi:hypothetical protein
MKNNDILIFIKAFLILSSEVRGRNFSVLRYEPVLKIDPYQRKTWNSAKEIERRF